MQLKNRIARYLGVVLPCTLILAAAPANAELYQFSYTFTDTRFQTYASGSQLSGFLEGTPDPANPDRILITDFGSVSLTIPGYGQFNFPTIDPNEITTYPADGRAPVATLSGTELAFSVCPNGFTNAQNEDLVLNDCPFARDGGFFLDSYALGFSYATTAIGGMETAPCYDEEANFTRPNGTIGNNTLGCRVTDLGADMASAWQMALVNVDPSVDIDPSVTLGDNTTLDKGVAVEENVTVGDNVTLDKGSSIGADSDVGADTTLDQGTSIGSNVTIGANVTIDADVEIQDGVTIGDNVHIGRGAVICSGITIGDSATIGKNAVVDLTVGPFEVIAKDYPGACTP